MKQQDIAIVIIIVFIAAVASFIVSGKVFSTAGKKLTAETVTPITSEFVVPDDTVLNTEAVNPTRRIEIGPNANNQPFASQQQ